MMNRLLERSGDTVALGAGLLLAVVVIAAYAYGITSAAQDLDAAVNPDQAAAPVPVYDLEAASKLDLKGLTPRR